MTFGHITPMSVMVTTVRRIATIARNARKQRGSTRTKMAETTRITHRKDGLYDLTLKDGNTYIIKQAMTMQEVVAELERELNQWEDDLNGRE